MHSGKPDSNIDLAFTSFRNLSSFVYSFSVGSMFFDMMLQVHVIYFKNASNGVFN